MFKFRDKKEIIGVILGSICFLPSFLIVLLLDGLSHPVIGGIVLIITQTLWLASITLSVWSLEEENKELKEKLKSKN